MLNKVANKTGTQTLALAILLIIVFAITAQAATYTVTKIEDTNDGVCDADCSLREALSVANTSPENDVIEFASPLFDTPQTIALEIGQLDIVGNGTLVLNGPGANKLVILGNYSFPVFNAISGANALISGLLIRNGINGVTNRALLTIRDCFIYLNFSNRGGGIFNLGTLVVENSTISHNIAELGGGGIYNDGNLHVINSTISSNQSGSDGGGIINAGNFGGFFPQSQITVLNTTISDNISTNGSVGGFYNRFGIANITNSIIANSRGDHDCITFAAERFELYSTLIEDGFCGAGNGANGNMSGDPNIALLGYRGGPTPTHVVLPGSPAIDTADPTHAPATDQRGITRPLDGNADGTVLPDRGSVEAIIETVTKIEDTNDNVCDADCSLREAIEKINTTGFSTIIEFASPLFDTPQTISLTQGEIVLNPFSSAVVNGKGSDLLTITANNLSRVFAVDLDGSLSLSRNDRKRRQRNGNL